MVRTSPQGLIRLGKGASDEELLVPEPGHSAARLRFNSYRCE